MGDDGHLVHDPDRIEIERVMHHERSEQNTRNMTERFIQDADRMTHDPALIMHQNQQQSHHQLMSPIHHLVSEKNSIPVFQKSNLLEPKHE